MVIFVKDYLVDYLCSVSTCKGTSFFGNMQMLYDFATGCGKIGTGLHG